MRWMAGVGIAILVACGGRGSPGDGGAGPGAVGSPCVRNADCDRGFCLPITDTRSVCSETCSTSDDCVAGWTCGPVSGVSDDLCSCEPMAEDCDGIDDDCDGVVDDGIGAAIGCPVGNECVDAACGCSAANTCDGSCVDLSSDPANCGACGTRCASVACAGGTCVAPAGITATGNHTCVWVADGPASCWGGNQEQQIVLDATSPVAPTLLEVGAVRMVSAGGSHTCVVAVDGNVVCLGVSDVLGGGPPEPSLRRATPITSGDAVGVVAGGLHSCAWLSDGRAYCWGLNTVGQLGTGPMGTVLYTPTLVEGLDPVVNMAAGGVTTCAVVQSGDLYCWGLIPGTTMTFSVTPVRIDLPGVEHLAVHSHVVAITSDEQLWAWGGNDDGQAGAEPVSPFLVATPTPIDALSSATGLAASFSHSCAVQAANVYCWGSNTNGQLGTGSTVSSYVPLLVLGGHSFRAIAAGSQHSCGIADDGIYCWGSDQSGQLGHGTTSATPQLTPTPVTNL